MASSIYAELASVRSCLLALMLLPSCSATGLAPAASERPAHDAEMADAEVADAEPWWGEPEHDLGPGARPSDRPEAADWEPPPGAGEERPCCTLSDPVRVADLDDGVPSRITPPLVAWGPGHWGLLVQYVDPAPAEGLVLRTFDRVGVPLRQIVVEPPPALPAWIDGYPRPEQLRWDRGRWAIAARTPGTEADARPFARLYDLDMTPLSEWLRYHDRPGSLVELVPHRGAWLGLSSDSRNLWGTSLPPGMEASDLARHDIQRLRAVGMESRAALLLRSPAAGHTLSVTNGVEELGRLPLRTMGAEADVGALRDLAVVAGWGNDVLRVQVADPFALEVRSAAVPIAAREPRRAGESEPRHSVAVVGSNKHGVAAVCYGVRAGAERGQIRLALIGADATRRGADVTVADSWFRFNDVNCSVGTDESGFLVAWWTGSELWVRRVDVARAP